MGKKRHRYAFDKTPFDKHNADAPNPSPAQVDCSQPGHSYSMARALKNTLALTAVDCSQPNYYSNLLRWSHRLTPELAQTIAENHRLIDKYIQTRGWEKVRHMFPAGIPSGLLSELKSVLGLKTVEKIHSFNPNHQYSRPWDVSPDILIKGTTKLSTYLFTCFDEETDKFLNETYLELTFFQRVEFPTGQRPSIKELEDALMNAIDGPWDKASERLLHVETCYGMEMVIVKRSRQTQETEIIDQKTVDRDELMDIDMLLTLARLDERERTAIRMRYLTFGYVLTISALAQKMKKSVKTVKGYLQSAFSKLRKVLKRCGDLVEQWENQAKNDDF